MKLSKEAKVWVKQQENRKESCRECIGNLKRQVVYYKAMEKFASKAVALEVEQIKCIDKELKAFLADWRKP